MSETSVGVQFNPDQKSGMRVALDGSDAERLHVRPRFRLGRTLFGLVALGFAAYGQLDAWSEREWGAFVFATLSAFAAMALLTLRRRLVLDRRESVLASERGLVLSHFRERRDLADFDRVAITLGEQSASQGATTVYPVRLEGRGENVEIDAPGYWEPARNMAEELAAFLRLPLVDTGRSGTLQPDELDRTVGRRDRPDTPESVRRRNSYRVEDDTDDVLRIVIPPPDYRPFLGIALIVSVFLLIPLFVDVFLPLIRGRPVDPVSAALPTFILVWVCFEMARVVLTNGGVLEVTPGALRLTGRAPWGSRTRTIPATELEDLVILDPESGGPRTMLAHFTDGVLVARSDRESIRFGYGLSHSELARLREKIVHVIGGRGDVRPRPKRHATAFSLPVTAPAGMLAGIVVAHAARGPLSVCVALPFLQHVVSVGALAGACAGLLAGRRLRPALAAAGLAFFLHSGSGARNDLVQDRPRFTQNPRYLKSAESLDSPRYLAGFLPVAALVNLAAFELTLTLAEVLRRRRRERAGPLRNT